MSTTWTSETTGTGAYAEVNGINLYYETLGSGRPMVLLHGGLGSGEMFGPILPALAAEHQVINVDLQGHGRTADVDRPLSYPRMADDTAAAVRHLEIEQLDVLGYSLGGAVALELAIRHPDLVRKLVVASTTFSTDGVYKEALDMFPTVTPELFKGTPIEEEYLRLAPNPDDFPKLVEKISALDANPWGIAEDDIRGIAAPTMIVAGDSDIARHEHLIEFFRLRGGGVMGDLSGMPASQLAILPGTSHYIPPGHGLLDRADWLLAMLPQFLDDGS
jgi:pimeloyl-ACP methyl ester carboxylesterase